MKTFSRSAGGCVLANRLSENPKWNVLLIEAGDVETPLQSVPVAAPYSVFTKYNWGYSAEPQTEACLGKLNQRVRINIQSSSCVTQRLNHYDCRSGR